LPFLAAPSLGFAGPNTEFRGIVSSDEHREALKMRDGTALVRIKISKLQGSRTMSFLSESFRSGDSLHKHLNEDELIFLHKGSGLLTLGDKEYAIKEGAVALVTKGAWHGLQNSGTQDIEMRFGYTPAGFEGFFREVGTPIGKPLVRKSMEERRAIAKKWGMIYRD
jgi:quercetin dioxygenase-like cupin family protein